MDQVGCVNKRGSVDNRGSVHDRGGAYFLSLGSVGRWGRVVYDRVETVNIIKSIN